MTKGGKVAAFAVMTALIGGTALIGLWISSYYSLPSVGPYVQGDPVLAYDPEIGFVPRPNSTSELYGSMHIYTDRRGARVSAPGEQTPHQVDIVTIGCSFTWGLGLENEQTFAYKIGRELGVSIANLSMGGYGTVHALQLLRRNADLKPKLVIYPFIYDHRRRNVLLCGPSAFPACMDSAHVKLDQSGQPVIVLPAADGVRRTELYLKAQTEGLDPLPWLEHGVDMLRGRVRQWLSEKATRRDHLQIKALHYLLEEMKRSTEEMGAKFLVVLLSYKGSSMPPGLAETLHRLNLDVLDLEAAYHRYESVPGRPPLHPAHDAHPTAAGNALIAQEIVAHVRRRGLIE